MDEMEWLLRLARTTIQRSCPELGSRTWATCTREKLRLWHVKDARGAVCCSQSHYRVRIRVRGLPRRAMHQRCQHEYERDFVYPWTDDSSKLFTCIHILLMLKLDDKHVYPNRLQIVHALASWVQFIGPFFWRSSPPQSTDSNLSLRWFLHPGCHLQRLLATRMSLPFALCVLLRISFANCAKNLLLKRSFPSGQTTWQRSVDAKLLCERI